MAANPFDYLNAINQTREDMVADEYGERQYNSFMVNRGLSYFKDTVIQANEMNRLWHLDKAIQFRFLMATIQPRKRFSKWFKAEKVADIEYVKEYFGYSDRQAKQVMDLLSAEDMERIKEKLYKGGGR
jgi:hypothetical protein